jgi:metal-dependent amidase/aminoacylase/carboxypeptidase family protein
MTDLQFYRERLRPLGSVNWEQWQSDMKRRLSTQKPIQYIDRLAPGLVFQTLCDTPEGSYQEVVTGAFIADYLLSRGLQLSPLTGIEPYETHLVFGGGDSFDLVLRCDLDAVAVGNGREQVFTHACGHATNMAAILTLAPFLGDITERRVGLIFQPAEEGPGREEDGYVHPHGYGGGQYLRRKGVYERVRCLISCHLDAKLKEKEIRVTSGLATAAAYRFKHVVTGVPCHAALPGEGSNPVDGVQAFLNRLDDLRVEFRLLPDDNYGLITTTQIRTSACDLNTLPTTASLEGIIRVVGHRSLEAIKRALLAPSDTSNRLSSQTTLELEAPPVQNDPELAAIASAVARAQGLEVVEAPARFRDETAWAGRFDEPWVENPTDWPAGCESILHFFVSPGPRSGPLHSPGFSPDPEAVLWQVRVLKGIVSEALKTVAIDAELAYR